MGISRRNPRGNFNWQSRILKKKAICCGQLNDNVDCDLFGPTLQIIGNIICKPSVSPTNQTVSVANTQPGQAATTLYEWYEGGPGGPLYYSSYGGSDSSIEFTVGQQIPGTTTFWLVVTNSLGCVTSQYLNIYVFNTPVIGKTITYATDPCVPSVDPSGFSSNGLINAINLNTSPNALYYEYTITYGVSSPNPGYQESHTTTAGNYQWTDLCDGTYTLGITLWGNIDGVPTAVCNATPVFVNFGRLVLTFDDIANVPVANPLDVNQWGAIQFYVPTSGLPFSSVSVVGNTVYLAPTVNGSILQSGTNPTWYAHLESITDSGGWVNNQIGDFAFYQAPLLKNVEMKYAKSIGVRAFERVPIKTADFPNVISVYTAAFVLCQVLNDVKMDSVTTIGGSAFGATELLSNIYMPEVLTIGPDAFSGNPAYPLNYSLVSVSLPKVTTVSAGAFQLLPALADVDFPLALSVGNVVFKNCYGLIKINLPSCTFLGASSGDNNVFSGITGNTIGGTFNASLQTNNAGGLDGDLVYLNANNTVTFIWV